MTHERPWAEYLRVALVNDPEWVNYLATLSPRTPLNRAVDGYVRLLMARIALTPSEVKAANEILTAMSAYGIEDANDVLEAFDEWEVERTKPQRSRNEVPRESGLEPGRP